MSHGMGGWANPYALVAHLTADNAAILYGLYALVTCSEQGLCLSALPSSSDTLGATYTKLRNRHALFQHFSNHKKEGNT